VRRIDRLILPVLAAATLFASLPVSAQASGKIPRIGVLSGGTAATAAGRHEALRQGLRDLGYVEGQTIAIEYRYSEGKPAALPALAAELVRLKPDLVVTSGDPQIRLELLKTAFPKISRVAMLWNPDNAANVAGFKETEIAARTLGVQLLSLSVPRLGDLESGFQAALRGRADALISGGDTILLTRRSEIVGFAAKHRLPAMYGNQDYIDVGGLMSYGPNVADMYRRAATYVDKILKGAKPGDLPVEQPTKFELVINLKTAKTLGLMIPPSVLARADRVIE
jgi:putative ABC transport system substrate-binding protein